MDFKNAKEILALCQEKNLPISEVMRQREILLGETLSLIHISEPTRPITTSRMPSSA